MSHKYQAYQEKFQFIKQTYLKNKERNYDILSENNNYKFIFTDVAEIFKQFDLFYNNKNISLFLFVFRTEKENFSFVNFYIN